MKIYVVVSKFSGSGHVVIARNTSEAIEMMANYLNQFKEYNFYETSDFFASAINIDKFSKPTLIF